MDVIIYGSDKYIASFSVETSGEFHSSTYSNSTPRRFSYMYFYNTPENVYKCLIWVLINFIVNLIVYQVHFMASLESLNSLWSLF